MLDAGAYGTNIRMCVGMSVDCAVVEGAAPGTMVDEDGVTSPAEARAAPAEDTEGRTDDDGGAETDSGGDYEARTWRVEDDRGAVDGDVVVGGVDGLDF